MNKSLLTSTTFEKYRLKINTSKSALLALNSRLF